VRNDRRTRVGYVRSTRCCGSPRRGIAARPVWTAPTGTPQWECPGNNRDLHRFLAAKRNPPGFLGKATCRSGLRQVGKHEARANYVRFTDVAVLPGGALQPAPSGPHQQGPPPWEFPGSNRDPVGSWQHGGTPWVLWQRRRDDPQAVLDRLACGEPDARVSVHPLTE